MTQQELDQFEVLIKNKMSEIATPQDPAHDLEHFNRVVATSKKLCKEEGASYAVVMPAAWLHDFVIIPKQDPRRSLASKLSAEGAIDFLKAIGYPSEYYPAIFHAIEAHSFSANIPTNSKEAMIVQDADRLDGLGAIGIARCFATAGLMQRALYSGEDPFAQTRALNDYKFTVDHFYVKLFKVVDLLKTEAGKKEGLRRRAVMQRYLKDLEVEIHQYGYRK